MSSSTSQLQSFKQAISKLRPQKRGFDLEVYGTRVFPVADDGEIESMFINTRFQRDKIRELTSRVGKLCVFNSSSFREEEEEEEETEQQYHCGTSTLKRGEYHTCPMSQGTVIELSEDLMVTARHVLQKANGELIDSSNQIIFVHFGSQPAIPKNSSLESVGWIPVEPYSFEHTDLLCSSCKNNQDFVFLKRMASRSASTQLPLPNGINGAQLLYAVFCNCCNTCVNVTTRSHHFVVLGFYDSVSTETLEDFFQEMGVLTKEQCIRLYNDYHAHALNRKLILCEKECATTTTTTTTTSNSEDTSVSSGECAHILKHGCLTASGVSGGMVALVNDSRVPLFCAMHLARDSAQKGQCLKANVFIAAPTTDA